MQKIVGSFVHGLIVPNQAIVGCAQGDTTPRTLSPACSIQSRREASDQWLRGAKKMMETPRLMIAAPPDEHEGTEQSQPPRSVLAQTAPDQVAAADLGDAGSHEQRDRPRYLHTRIPPRSGDACPFTVRRALRERVP